MPIAVKEVFSKMCLQEAARKKLNHKYACRTLRRKHIQLDDVRDVCMRNGWLAWGLALAKYVTESVESGPVLNIHSYS